MLAVIGGLFVYLSLQAEGGLSLTQVNGRNGSTTVTKKIAVVAVLCAVLLSSHAVVRSIGH
jgi:hypothetical protein